MTIATAEESSTTVDDSNHTLLRRRPGTVVAGLTSIAMIVGLLRNFLNAGTFGIDFGVFYVGGSIARSDGLSAVYNNDAFTERLVADYFPSLEAAESLSHFISPPPFAWIAQALSLVPFNVSLALWLAASVGAVVLSVRLLDLPWWTTLAVLISPSMSLNILLGQAGAFFLLLFVFLHRATRDENAYLAGVIAGLLILKPPLAFGFGVLWLFKRGQYLRSIGIAALVGLVVASPTVVNGIDSWRTFFGTMEERTEFESGVISQSPAIGEFLKLVSPGAPLPVTLSFWAAGILVGAIVIVTGARRYNNDPEMLSALAVLATLFAAPHLIVYDTLIVLIPVAVAYRRGLLTGDRAGTLAAIYAVGLAFGPELYVMQFKIFGRGIGLETPAVLACIWLLVRWDNEAEKTRPEPAEVSGAVLADA